MRAQYFLLCAFCALTVVSFPVFGTVSAMQVERFHVEAKKGLLIVLCMHVPFFTEAIWLAHEVFWRNGEKYSEKTVAETRGDMKRQREDSVTRDFIAYLKSEPLLKGILAGHLHINVQDRFSPTAMEYVVGCNFIGAHANAFAVVPAGCGLK